MSAKTGIQWTDATWSPITGCTRVSEGCRNCYSERLTATRMRQNPRYAGLAEMTQSGPRWTNEVRCDDAELLKPLRWKSPRRIFVNSMSDTFHEKVPFEFIDKIFAVMALCPQHVFQVLTKRPERMAKYLNDPTPRISGFSNADSHAISLSRPEEVGMWIRGCGSDFLWKTQSERDRQSEIGCGLQFRSKPWPLPNVWLGTSCEDQKAADERIPHLLRCPASVRFLSCEPLLCGISLFAWLQTRVEFESALHNALYGLMISRDELEEALVRFDLERRFNGRPGIDWVIIGGESGPGARSMQLGWAQSLIDQCAAGVPAFMKQLGAKPFGLEPDGSLALWPVSDSHGSQIEEFPEGLRVRQFPGAQRC